MGRIIEGYWDCKYCDSKGISGSIRECPNCGHPRDDTVKFYLKDEKKYVSEEKAKTINKNPDWICPYCNCLNSDSNETCVSCGSPRTKENLNYFENHEERKRKEEKKKSTIENTTFNQTSHSYKNDFSSSIASNVTSKKSNNFPFRILLIILSISLLIGGLIYLFLPKEQEILVQELSWEYSINIEKFKTVEENGLSLPIGARLKYTDEEISHYVEVIDHYETKTRQVEKQKFVGYEKYTIGYKDLGNGYFEEETGLREVYESYYVTENYKEPVYIDQPVYQTRYYYEIDKWVHERTVTTNGNTKETYWGETNLLDNERVSSKNESYFVSGLNTKKEKQTKIQVSFDDWKLISVDTKVKFKVSLGIGTLVKD